MPSKKRAARAPWANFLMFLCIAPPEAAKNDTTEYRIGPAPAKNDVFPGRDLPYINICIEITANQRLSFPSREKANGTTSAAPTLERDPHSKFHLSRSPVGIRARTGQNPVQPRGAKGG